MSELDAATTMTESASPASDAPGCALCSSLVPQGETRTADGRALCTRCADSLAADLKAERNIGPRLPLALGGGAAGALVAAAVWAAIVVFTNYEVGYVAVLVGFLAGHGVKLGAGKARGKPLQVAAAGLAVVGLVVAKYFTFAHFVSESLAEEGIAAGPFHAGIMAAFPGALPELLSPFDLLWVALALGAAWKVPAASQVTLRS